MTKAIQSKRILMLASQHSPYDGRIYHLEAKTLVAAGYKVSIVAPGDKEQSIINDGIQIFTYKKNNSGLSRKWSTLSKLISFAVRLKPDFIHVHEVDASLLAGSIAKRRLNRMGHPVKLVFDSHEVWPYFYAGKTGNKIAGEFIKLGVISYETRMLDKSVDAIITAHEIEENYYRFLNPWIPVRKVLGGPPIEEWPAPPARSGPVQVIGHDGYFMLQRGMHTMLGAFERIAPEYPSVQFLAAGRFHTNEDKKFFDQWCTRTGLGDRVEYAGWVDRSDIVSYLDRMDIGLVANKPDIHSIRCWPANKMMYYLGRGLAVVSTPAPLYKYHIERIGCGKVAGDFSSEAMANALRILLESPEETRLMGERAYKAAIKEFSWKDSKENLLELYREIA